MPVTPSKLCGVLNDAEVEGAPLNLTVSPVDLPCPGSDTFIIPDEAAIVSKGFGPNIAITSFSVLSGLASNKPSASPPLVLNSNCGCFLSNSERCTKEPFHSLTISLYGNSIPDLSDIAFEYFPLASMFLGNKF